MMFVQLRLRMALKSEKQILRKFSWICGTENNYFPDAIPIQLAHCSLFIYSNQRYHFLPMQAIQIDSNVESTLAASNSYHDSGYPFLPLINTAKSMDFFSNKHNRYVPWIQIRVSTRGEKLKYPSAYLSCIPSLIYFFKSHFCEVTKYGLQQPK